MEHVGELAGDVLDVQRGIALIPGRHRIAQTDQRPRRQPHVDVRGHLAGWPEATSPGRS